eukprot:gene8772-7776_t
MSSKKTRKQVKAYLEAPFQLTLQYLKEEDEKRIMTVLRDTLKEYTKTLFIRKRIRAAQWEQQKKKTRKVSIDACKKNNEEDTAVRTTRRQRRKNKKSSRHLEKIMKEKKKKSFETSSTKKPVRITGNLSGSKDIFIPRVCGSETAVPRSDQEAASSLSQSSPAITSGSKHKLKQKLENDLKCTTKISGGELSNSLNNSQEILEDKNGSNCVAQESSTCEDSSLSITTPLNEKQLSVFRRCILTGINASTRALEKGIAHALLLNCTTEPNMLIQHLPSMCSQKNVPIIPLRILASELPSIFCLPRVAAVTLSIGENDHNFDECAIDRSQVEQLKALKQLCVSLGHVPRSKWLSKEHQLPYIPPKISLVDATPRRNRKNERKQIRGKLRNSRKSSKDKEPQQAQMRQDRCPKSEKTDSKTKAAAAHSHMSEISTVEQLAEAASEKKPIRKHATILSDEEQTVANSSTAKECFVSEKADTQPDAKRAKR